MAMNVYKLGSHPLDISCKVSIVGSDDRTGKKRLYAKECYNNKLCTTQNINMTEVVVSCLKAISRLLARVPLVTSNRMFIKISHNFR
jgi:hypothetical protein